MAVIPLDTLRGLMHQRRWCGGRFRKITGYVTNIHESVVTTGPDHWFKPEDIAWNVVELHPPHDTAPSEMSP